MTCAATIRRACTISCREVLSQADARQALSSLLTSAVDIATCTDIMQALEVEYLQDNFLSIWRPMQFTMQTLKCSSFLLQDNALVRWCPSVPHCGRTIQVAGEVHCEP